MKKISVILWISVILFSFLGCNKEENNDGHESPVIELDNKYGIYQTKIGREITISPIFSNTTDHTSIIWTNENGEIVSTEKAFTFSSDKEGRYYYTVSVITEYGEDDIEVRIDVLLLDVPKITLAGSDQGFNIMIDQPIEFKPSISSELPASFEWKINSIVVSNERDYVFESSEAGEFPFVLSVTNEDGSDELSFVVKVLSPKDMPFSWSFDKTEYNVKIGTEVLITPIDIINAFDATYTFWIDDDLVQQSENTQYSYIATNVGAHIVKIQMDNSYRSVQQEIRINVIDESSHQRLITESSIANCNKVYEFLPAPGQFVNENYTATTMAQACSYAEGRFAQTAYVSLGGFGGYIVVGFDHSIVNDGDYNIAITGNAFDGSSEPGIVWVMQDENGDGIPNDTWYELKGSEYGLDCTIQDYAVTYYRPSDPKMEVSWTDNKGQSGTIDYLGAFHTQDYYYPAWVEENSYTLRGTCLEARNYDQSGNGTYWINPSYGWGYVDNFSAIDRLTDDDNYAAAPSDNHFKISDAVTKNGQPANLDYIDFVKVQVGINTKSGWLGEVSTEVFGVKDFNMLKNNK